MKPTDPTNRINIKWPTFFQCEFMYPPKQILFYCRLRVHFWYTHSVRTI